MPDQHNHYSDDYHDDDHDHDDDVIMMITIVYINHHPHFRSCAFFAALPTNIAVNH